MRGCIDISTFIPNEDQYELLARLHQWWTKRYKQIFVYSGGPGTGKTTVIKEFLRYCNIGIDEVLAAAYSGKAVNVMCDQGLKAQTIHSTFYIPLWEKVVDEFGDPVLKNGRPEFRMEFVLRETLPSKAKLIIIDELSMVPDDIMEDILSFGLPVVGIGDINQLPPIFGACSYMLRPDFMLHKIMRQAEDDPIVQFCRDVLDYKPLRYGTYEGPRGTSRIMNSIEMDENLVQDYDMIICCRNKTRDDINNHIRRNICKRPKYPVEQDKVICRQNVKDRSNGGRFLTNGTIGWVDYILPGSMNKKKAMIDFVPDYDTKTTFPNLEIDLEYLLMSHEERKNVGMRRNIKFEYGNVITAHLSQGSQYDRLLFLADEPFGDRSMIRSLKYTAISRAVKSIDIVMRSSYT